MTDVNATQHHPAPAPNAPANTPLNTIPSCPVCRQPLAVRLAHGRQSKKPFLMLVCATDGRHIRAFVNDKQFVAGVVARLEAQQANQPAA